MVKGVFTAVILATLALPAEASGDIQELAKTLTTAAATRRIKRVAIVPFTGPRGASSYSGSIVSERLVTQILARGDLDLVERRLLDRVLDEQRLGVFGIMDQDTVKTLGKVLGVDAILTGSIVELRNEKIEINARLINAETAQVLAADSARMTKDWEDRPIGEDMSTWIVPVPELNGDFFKSGGTTCLSRVDEVERRLLDFKARYWAERLKDPSFTLRSLKRNPGSEIRDEDTRKLFFEKLRERYDAPARTPLLPAEQAALAKGLEEVKVLTGLCGS